MRVVWFSGGVSSAVAVKLVVKELDKIIYTHIDNQHPDTMRFIKDCEKWFDKKVEVMQSHLKTVENAILMAGGRGYINGARGAACTKRLKRDVRKEWERVNGKQHTYYWGIDANESHRAERIVDGMPEQDHRFPLIENEISKTEAHKILKASGIERPYMYKLGYLNNNCVGCVKGGKGYWNKIRKDFPDVFKKMAELERKVGASCLHDQTGRIYLDELDDNAGRNQKPIVDDCGIFCEIMSI